MTGSETWANSRRIIDVAIIIPFLRSLLLVREAEAQELDQEAGDGTD